MRPDQAEKSKRAIEAARYGSDDATVEQLAELFSVSVRTILYARRVLKLGSQEMIDAIESGRMTVWTADNLVAVPQEANRTKVAKTKTCKRCRQHRIDNDRLRKLLADMTHERNRYYAELEAVRETNV
jgi:transposase-like protein